MARNVTLGYLLLHCLVMVTIQASEGSSQVKLTPSGNLLRCSQEALNKSQEIDKKEKKTIKEQAAYYIGFCGNFKCEWYQEAIKPLPVGHYHSDFFPH